MKEHENCHDKKWKNFLHRKKNANHSLLPLLKIKKNYGDKMRRLKSGKLRKF